MENNLNNVQNDEKQMLVEEIIDSEKNNENKKDKEPKPKTKKWLIIFGIVVVAIIAVICIFTEKDEEVKEEAYLNIVQLTEDVYTGAEFNLSLEEAKKIIGRELQMGDLNSIDGWKCVDKDDNGLEIYSIESTGRTWAAQLGVNPSTGNVVVILLLTKLDVMDNSSNMNSFCTAFSKCLNEELSVETLQSAYTSICEEGGTVEGNGVLCAMGTYNDWQTLQLTAINRDKKQNETTEEITKETEKVENTNEYLDVVLFTDDIYTGAEFDLKLENAKTIVEEELQNLMEDSDAEWQNYGVDEEGIEMHVITSGRNWTAHIGINPNTGNVVMITIYTKYDVIANSPVMEALCTAFSKCINEELSEEVIQDIYKSVYEQDTGLGYKGTFSYMVEYEELQGLCFMAASNDKLKQ